MGETIAFTAHFDDDGRLTGMTADRFPEEVVVELQLVEQADARFVARRVWPEDEVVFVCTNGTATDRKKGTDAFGRWVGALQGVDPSPP